MISKYFMNKLIIFKKQYLQINELASNNMECLILPDDIPIIPMKNLYNSISTTQTNLFTFFPIHLGKQLSDPSNIYYVLYRGSPCCLLPTHDREFSRDDKGWSWRVTAVQAWQKWEKTKISKGHEKESWFRNVPLEKHP